VNNKILFFINIYFLHKSCKCSYTPKYIFINDSVSPLHNVAREGNTRKKPETVCPSLWVLQV